MSQVDCRWQKLGGSEDNGRKEAQRRRSKGGSGEGAMIEAAQVLVHAHPSR